MADKVYLVDLDYIDQYGLVDINIDPKKIRPIILRTQKTKVEPVLGTMLYEKVLADILANNLTGLYKELVDDFVLDFMVPWIDWEYTFHGTSQMSNKTVGKNQDQNITPNTQDDNENLRNKLKKDAWQYKRKLIGWLQDNRDDIPEYCDKEVDKEHQSILSVKGGDSSYDSTLSVV